MTDSVSLYNKILSFINNEYDSIIPNNTKANDINTSHINISNINNNKQEQVSSQYMDKANDDITNDTPGSTEVLENLIHMDTDNVNGGIAMETLTENLVGGNNVKKANDISISSYNNDGNINDTSISSSSHNTTKANDKQKTLSNTDITKEIYETTIKQFDTNLLEGGDGTKHDKDTKSDTKASDHNTSNDKANDNTKHDDKHKDKDKSKESSDDSSDDESKDDLTKNITININNTGTENINEESSSSSSSDEEEEIIQEPINNNKDISHIPTNTTNTSNDTRTNTSKTNDTKHDDKKDTRTHDEKKDASSQDTSKTNGTNINNDKANDDKKDTKASDNTKHDDKKDDKNKINKAIDDINNTLDDDIGDITILNGDQPGDDNNIGNSIIFGSDSEDTEYDCSNSSDSSCDEYSDDEGEVSKFAMFLKKFQNKNHIDYEDNTTVTGGNNTQELEVLTMFPYLVR